MALSVKNNRPIAYAISNRKALPNGEDVPTFVRRIAEAGADMVQIREKDLSDRILIALVRECLDAVAGTETQLLVNDRLDIAIAAGADGVHLGGHSAEPALVRRRAPQGMIIGVSTHNRSEIQAAEEGDADFITFSPVFPTTSKAEYGPPQGLQALVTVVQGTRLPVLALGGIAADNVRATLKSGAAGIAAISLFQIAADVKETIDRIHRGN